MDKMQDFHSAIMYMQYFSISEDSYKRHSGEAAINFLPSPSHFGIFHWQDIYDNVRTCVWIIPSDQPY